MSLLNLTIIKHLVDLRDFVLVFDKSPALQLKLVDFRKQVITARIDHQLVVVGIVAVRAEAVDETCRGATGGQLGDEDKLLAIGAKRLVDEGERVVNRDRCLVNQRLKRLNLGLEIGLHNLEGGRDCCKSQ